MNLLEFKKFIKVDLTETDSVEMIKYKYTKLLNIFNYCTGYESFGISFKRKIYAIANSGEYRSDVLKIFREGDIFIFIENNKLNVNWSVKLDTLYFLSFLISVVLTLLTSFFLNSPLFISILTGLIGFIFLCVIGILIINTKINEINNTCLELLK